MTRSRRKRKELVDRTTGITLFVVGLVLLMALAGGALWLRKTRVQLATDLCPATGASAIQMIMIDRSDPISGQQAQRVRQYINEIKENALPNTRFDVYVFEGDIKNELRPILSICKPKRPEDANDLTENREFIRRRYEGFSTDLNKTIDSLMTANTLPNSPIIESLRAAALSSFGPDVTKSIPRHVTLISDMVQNTSSVSHFRAVPDFSTLAKTINWAAIKPSLHGADVVILYLLRPGAMRGHAAIQNRGHEQFWEELILASDGKLIKIEMI